MPIGSSRFPRGGQRKFRKISFGTVFRVILRHPFVLVTVLYLIILHKYFPFLFSILVSASPVIICTALLLGTLLIHGQQQDHRAGNRDERSNVPESSTNGVVDDTYADNDGFFQRERFGNIRDEKVETEVTISRGFQVLRGFQFGDFDFKDAQKLELQASDHGEQYRKTVNDGVENRALDVMIAEVIPNPQETHPLLGFEDLRHTQASDDAALKSEVQSIDSIRTSEDSDNDEKDDDVDDDDDQAPRAINGKSTSPFAWTDNDQRILQELRSSEIEKNEHLESLIARAEDDGSEELENEDEGESTDGIDDDVDDEEEEEEEEEEEDGNLDVEKDGSEKVTLWTEEDEKNLRHLGCSELERNLRLENLLLRRRAKRNFSMISERNLIDLDKIVPPFPVPPISTTRVNPFDNADDASHHHPSVPPIPGSAPSVTLPRKNPFDSPCTSPKRAQNIGVLQSVKESPSVFHETGSSSRGYNVPKPELVDKNRKEALFRRYESFSAGFNMMEDASTRDFMEFSRKDFVFRRHETFNTRTPYFSANKPVFVPEQVDRDVWHPSLDRQLSHGTESVESATSTDTETSIAHISHQEEESDSPNEIDHTSSHLETGSESSEAADSIYDDQDGHSVEAMEVNVDHVIQQQEVLHGRHDNDDGATSSPSSPLSSSSSEHGAEDSMNDSRIEHEQVEASGFSPKDSMNMSEASHMSTDDDHPPVEPVYDTSPSGVDKNIAFGNSPRG